MKTSWTTILRRYGADVVGSMANLRAQKTRTFLTALGIVFGVGSVIGMLAIGEGAKEESLRFIEQLGVRNILIDSRPVTSFEELQQRRRNSPGLTERDVRIIEANVDALETLSPRLSLHPQTVVPKSAREVPELYGVRPSFAVIHNVRMAEGKFFDSTHNDSSTAVCVLGEKAKVSLLGYGKAVGQFVKVNDTWLEVVGVLGERIGTTQGSGANSRDINNAVYIPLNTFQYRYWDRSSFMRDELDGVDIRLKPGADSVEVSKVVQAILNSTHHNTQDFSVTIPAALLAQQQQTQKIFTYVMVAIAAISLLVGGIGIMNIVLATVMERTREIGIQTCDRRAPQRHHPSVPDGIGADFRGRRTARNRLRLRSVLADCERRRVEDNRLYRFGYHRVRCVRRGRRDLRNLSRDEGFEDQSDRRAALRIVPLRSERRRTKARNRPPVERMPATRVIDCVSAQDAASRRPPSRALPAFS